MIYHARIAPVIINFKRWLYGAESLRHPKPAFSGFVFHDVHLLPVEGIQQLIHHDHAWIQQTCGAYHVAHVVITFGEFVQTQDYQMLGDAVVRHEVWVVHVMLVVGKVDGAELATYLVESNGSIVKHLLIFVVMDS